MRRSELARMRGDARLMQRRYCAMEGAELLELCAAARKKLLARNKAVMRNKAAQRRRKGSKRLKASSHFKIQICNDRWSIIACTR